MRGAISDLLGLRESDAAGYTKGQGNLSITARELATIGEMVRNDGTYRGHRIVSAAWLRAALAPKVTISGSDPYADGYGYFWYSKVQQIEGKPVPVSFASGNGGNKIYVVPSRHLVVAITSSAYGHGYGQRRSENILRAIIAFAPLQLGADRLPARPLKFGLGAQAARNFTGGPQGGDQWGEMGFVQLKLG